MKGEVELGRDTLIKNVPLVVKTHYTDVFLIY